MTFELDDFLQASLDAAKDEYGEKFEDPRLVDTADFFGEAGGVVSIRLTGSSSPTHWAVGTPSILRIYDQSIAPASSDAYTYHMGVLVQEYPNLLSFSVKPPVEKEFDAFICHASEDKQGFVEPLASELTGMGFRIWYDDFVLKVGDSLRMSIDEGLARSRYGIVVFSDSFFGKSWPERELSGLVAKETSIGIKLILPIWHGIDKEVVLQHSPTLADKVALKTADLRIEEIAKRLAVVIRAEEAAS